MIKLGMKELVSAAQGEVASRTPQDLMNLQGKEEIVLVDVRDGLELQRDGTIPGAIHASRGMLELHVDPNSPAFKEVFGEDKAFVFYCASGGRSALAAQTVQRMGLPRVSFLSGGVKAWREMGGTMSPADI